MGLAGCIECHGRFGGQIEESKGLLQIKSNMRVSVTQVANGGVLAEVKIEVAASGGDDEGAVDGGRPDDFAVDQAFDVFEDRIAVIAGFGKFGISIGAEQDGVGAVDADETQLAQGLRKGFRILAHVGGKRFLGITGALADPDDSSGGVAFENGAVFGKRELACRVLCGLPIGVICAAFDVVNHLAIELERNAELDKRFHFAQLSGCAVFGRLDRALMTCAHSSQRGARRAVNIRHAASGKIPLDRA